MQAIGDRCEIIWNAALISACSSLTVTQWDNVIRHIRGIQVKRLNIFAVVLDHPGYLQKRAFTLLAVQICWGPGLIDWKNHWGMTHYFLFMTYVVHVCSSSQPLATAIGQLRKYVHHSIGASGTPLTVSTVIMLRLESRPWMVTTVVRVAPLMITSHHRCELQEFKIISAALAVCVYMYVWHYPVLSNVQKTWHGYFN